MSCLQFPVNSTMAMCRKNCSFNTNDLKMFMFTADLVNIKNKIYEEIRKYPILYTPTNGPSLNLDEQKFLSAKKCLLLRMIRLKVKDLTSNPYFSLGWSTVTEQVEKSSCVQADAGFQLFSETLLALGTDRHKPFHDTKIIGSFCLTEVGHGSNTKRLKTIAKYDNKTKEFVIHSPNFQAAKCWIANLGKLATHAIVYGQLITPDNKEHGLHAFVVPIRDQNTFLPFSGVLIADLGEKLGLQGLDNGLIMFNNYRIPKLNLLNKSGDVTDDGRYVSNTVIGQSHLNFFKVLIRQRLGVIAESSVFLNRALTVAVRCAIVRKDFRAKDTDELPVSECQSYQFRLLPYLAFAYITILFLNYTVKHKHLFNLNCDISLLKELNAVASAGKSYFSSLTRDAIQECSETCGDLGYLSVSGFGEIKNNIDATLTYDGDNNILIQQTSNWLLKLWPLVTSKNLMSSLASAGFLNNALDILQQKFKLVPVEEFCLVQNIHKYYQWLVCYLLKKSYEKCKCLDKTFKSEAFWIRSNSQIYHLRSLSIAYFESFVLQQTCLMVEGATSAPIKNVLNKLVSLYAVWSLQKHVSFFYEGQYTDNPLFSKHIEDSILLLCDDLKNDVVSLVDVIAPPDDLMKSILGHSDGKLYTKLLNAVMQNPEGFSNAMWLNNLNSKL